MLLGPVVCLLDIVEIGNGTGGVVGIVEVKQLGVLGNLVQVQEPVVLCLEFHFVAYGVVEEGGGSGVHRVTGGGCHDLLSVVDEGLCDVVDSLFGTDGDADVLVGVHVDVEPLLVVLCDGDPEVPLSLGGGVLLVLVDAGGLVHGVEDLVGTGEIGVSDSEVDHLHAFRLLLGGKFLQHHEEVGREFLQSFCLCVFCHIIAYISWCFLRTRTRQVLPSGRSRGPCLL